MAASDPDAARCRIATQFLESELDYWLSLQNAFKHYYKPLLSRVPDVLGRLLSDYTPRMCVRAFVRLVFVCEFVHMLTHFQRHVDAFL